MSDAAIEFDHVFYTLPKKGILFDLHLEVASGETLVLLGRSGSGKTTSLKLVNRLLEPTSGEVRVQGKSTTAWNAISLRRRIGYVIQEIGLFPHFTVERNVGLVPALERWPREQTRRRVRELLSLVGLNPADFAGRYPDQLSGGQRQRVGVARALAADPPVLLLDEPFGALDPLTRSEIQQEFLRLQSQLKKSALFVTHDLYEALALGDRIGLLQEGKLIFLGSRQQLVSSSNPEIERFLAPVRSLSESLIK